MDQLLDLFPASLLLGLGFRYVEMRSRMSFEADAFAGCEWCMKNGTGCLMQGIFSDIGDASVETCYLMAGFLTVL